MKRRGIVASTAMASLLVLSACAPLDSLSAEVAKAKAEATTNTDPTKGWVFVKSETSTGRDSYDMYTTTVWKKCEGQLLAELTATPVLSDERNNDRYIATLVKTQGTAECTESK